MASLANCNNKLKEYSLSLDGHSFRAASYFKDELEARGIFIDPSNVDSVNSIKKLAPDLRQESKGPTFALAYGSGTQPIINALKCSKAKAEYIYDSYKELYPELDDYFEDSVRYAKINGFVTGFFGLKLRCPSINSNDKAHTSSIGRSITNMRIQSGAMLTVKSLYEFQGKIEELGVADSIRFHATTHDSVYLYFKPLPEIIKIINTYLVDFMCAPYPGQIVENEAELDIGTSWAWLSTIKKHSDELDYSEVIEEAKENILEDIKKYEENH